MAWAIEFRPSPSLPRALDARAKGITVSRQPHPSSEPSAAQSVRFALAVALTGILAVLAASVDPWMLVMIAGVALTGCAVYDRTDPGWYAL